MSLARALDGVKVLDLSRLLPGPFLTMILADLGADVIKVEAPGAGDYLRTMFPGKQGMSGRFLAVNRNKRSLVLDLKTAPGRDAFLRLVAQADVVVESFRPGVMARLGLGYDALRAHNPRVILCSISGFGQDGPYQERAGHDLGYVALAGVLAMGGARGGAPAMPGAQIADLAGGALWGVTGILGALLGRARTGQGEHLDISMTEGALALLAAELGNLDCAPGARPSRGNQALNGGLACYRIYEAADGKYLAVGALEPKFWLALNQAIGRAGQVAELAAPPEKQEAIAAELAAIFRTRTRDAWMADLASHDCCCEPVLELDEVSGHPLHQARGVFFSLPGEDGAPDVQQVRTPLGVPASRGLAPRLGQHSRQVLAEYGFSGAEIDGLCGPPAA
jgi:crotonobetainyl-CoA:carnitine CoA-transferase CaiB-like acyl-CoA transferase